MIIYLVTFLVIVMLILTNAITDAPNAIATIVGTKTMKFKNAATLSAVFNFLGTFVMSFISISVANCISSMVIFENGINAMIGLAIAMFSVIIFALIAMWFGIPTSETHGLIAGLTGSTIALHGFEAINFEEWKNVIIGLVWSILGTYIITKIVVKLIKKHMEKIKEKQIRRYQIYGCCAMSFIHGAQDGQKFIGILILFFTIINNSGIDGVINPSEHIWVIVFVSILMSIGISIGGKRIVENIGSNMAKITNRQGLITDISTFITLFIASVTGLPVSTTHVKSLSIIGVAKSYNSEINNEEVKNIIKAWIYTFPICGAISYLFTKILLK